MAFSDWDITIGSGMAHSLQPNNGLANPLTDTGPDYRFLNAGTAIGTWRTQFMLKSTASGGEFYGSVAGFRTSITAWLRCNGGTENAGGIKSGGAWLMLKNTINQDFGYYLGLGDGHGTTDRFGSSGDGPGLAYRFCLALVCKNQFATKQIVLMRDELGTGVSDSVVVSRNRWYRIRMDLNSTVSADWVYIYVDDSGGGSPGTVVTGSENWKLLHSQQIVNGYRPFDPNHRIGWVTNAYQPVGFNAQGPHTYIDAFKVRKETI